MEKKIATTEVKPFTLTIMPKAKFELEAIWNDLLGILYKEALDEEIFNRANGLMNMWAPAREGIKEFYDWTREVEAAVGRNFMGDFIDRKVTEEDMKPVFEADAEMLQKAAGNPKKLEEVMAWEYGDWLWEAVQNATEILSKEKGIEEWEVYDLSAFRKDYKLQVTYGEILAFNLGMNLWIGWLGNRIEDSWSDIWDVFKPLAERFYQGEFIGFLEDIRRELAEVEKMHAVEAE